VPGRRQPPTATDTQGTNHPGRNSPENERTGENSDCGRLRSSGGDHRSSLPFPSFPALDRHADENVPRRAECWSITLCLALTCGVFRKLASHGWGPAGPVPVAVFSPLRRPSGQTGLGAAIRRTETRTGGWEGSVFCWRSWTRSLSSPRCQWTTPQDWIERFGKWISPMRTATYDHSKKLSHQAGRGSRTWGFGVSDSAPAIF
jgi:hypothetical protein